MIKKLDHIGIVVADLAASQKKYLDLLGLKTFRIENIEVEGGRNRIAFLQLDGIDLELVQASGDKGMAADFLRENGEGIHHLAFEVKDLEDIFQILRDHGVEFLWNKIIPGSRGTKVAFFAPEEFNGTLIELVEKPEGPQG